jgi:hypothetical protein
MTKQVLKKYSINVPLPELTIEYMQDRISEHGDPVRVGTARGEKIGLSQKKFIASLLVALLNYSLKKITEEYGESVSFSYGLLRKWKTEDDFKDAIIQHQKGCAEEIAKYIESRVHNFMDDVKNYENGKSNNIPSHVDFPKLKSCKHLNTKVIQNLEFYGMSKYEKSLAKSLKAGADEKVMVEAFTYMQISYLTDAMEGRKDSLTENMSEKFVKKVLLINVEFVEEILAKPGKDINEKERRRALMALEIIKKGLNNSV